MRTSNSSMGNHACKGRPAGKRGDTGAVGGVCAIIPDFSSWLNASWARGCSAAKASSLCRWITRLAGRPADMTVLGIRHVLRDAGLEEKFFVSTLFLMPIVAMFVGDR